MHHNTANRILKELQIARQHVNEAYDSLNQHAHPATPDVKLLLDYMEVVKNKILGRETS